MLLHPDHLFLVTWSSLVAKSCWDATSVVATVCLYPDCIPWCDCSKQVQSTQRRSQMPTCMLRWPTRPSSGCNPTSTALTSPVYTRTLQRAISLRSAPHTAWPLASPCLIILFGMPLACTCAFKPGCLMSHIWPPTPDCKLQSESIGIMCIAQAATRLLLHSFTQQLITANC